MASTPTLSREYRAQRTAPAALAFGVVAILLTGVIFWTVVGELSDTRDLAPLEPTPPPVPALTRHVLFFIIDGLRYEYGTDSAVVPNYARHMKHDANAMVMASPVTMTSSAVCGIGAGQRSSLAQIITNLNAPRTPHNHIVENLRRAGLRSALAGDETWHSILGDFDDQHFDKNGIALTEDNTPEIMAETRRMAGADPAPNLLIVHFIAPDHFGHAWSTTHPAYLALLRRLDADMQALFDALPKDWTVMAVSDHGASETGTHGTDRPMMRRTPMFAYGPGIRAGVRIDEIDQVDLGHTLAALLGIPGPSRGRGTAVTALLDIEPDQAAALACADAERVQRAARADGYHAMTEPLASAAAACGSAGASAQDRMRAGQDTVRVYDRLLDDERSSAGVAATLVAVLSILLALAVPAGLLASWMGTVKRSSAARFFALAVAVVALAVGLTWGVEKIPQPFDDAVRAVLFGVGNLLLLLGLLLPTPSARWVSRVPSLFLASVPGAIAWSYPTNTPHEAIAGLAVGAALWWFAPHADLRSFRSVFHGHRALPWWRIALGALALVGLLPAGMAHGDPTPAYLHQRPWLIVLLAVVAIGAWLFAGARSRDGRWRRADLAVAFVASVGSLLLRDRVPPDVGLAAMLGVPVLAAIALQRRRFTLAFGLGFAAWAWVSRNTEVVPFVCAALVLEAVGHAAADARRKGDPEAGVRPWMIASLALVLFGGVFLTRAALQGGLDLTNIDYNVGAFGDPHISEARATLAMIWKYLCAFLILMGCLVLPLGRRSAGALAFAFIVVFLVRAGTLAWMLFACRTSYWTALRTMSDCPFALIATWAGVVLLWIVTFGSERSVPVAHDARAGA